MQIVGLVPGFKFGRIPDTSPGMSTNAVQCLQDQVGLSIQFDHFPVIVIFRIVSLVILVVGSSCGWCSGTSKFHLENVSDRPLLNLLRQATMIGKFGGHTITTITRIGLRRHEKDRNEGTTTTTTNRKQHHHQKSNETLKPTVTRFLRHHYCLDSKWQNGCDPCPLVGRFLSTEQGERGKLVRTKGLLRNHHPMNGGRNGGMKK